MSVCGGGGCGCGQRRSVCVVSHRVVQCVLVVRSRIFAAVATAYSGATVAVSTGGCIAVLAREQRRRRHCRRVGTRSDGALGGGIAARARTSQLRNRNCKLVLSVRANYIICASWECRERHCQIAEATRETKCRVNEMRKRTARSHAYDKHAVSRLATRTNTPMIIYASQSES